MKSLICYASKRGTTLECSKIIASKIKNYDLIDIKEIKNISLSEYDKVFVGTPVYYGKINKRINSFLKTNKDALLEKDLRIFTVGMDDKNIKNTRVQNFDKEILESSIIKYVGGAYNFEKMNWLERVIVKKISSINESYQDIKNDKIDELINDKIDELINETKPSST